VNRKLVHHFGLLILGSLSIALATTSFLDPNHVITGGGVGIAQLLFTLFPSISLGSWIAIVAIPLILLGMRFFGKSFVLKTFLSIVLISLFTDLLQKVVPIPTATHDTLLAAIFGGFLIGLGVGLIMLARSSTGGTTILAEVIAKKTHYKTSQIILVIDTTIMFTSIFVYGDLEKALFSIIGIYVTSRVVDILLSGKPAQKAVSIVTHNAPVLSAQLLSSLGEHGTILEGKTLNQKDPRTIILIIVDISLLQRLKAIINEYDPSAFLVIQEASELYGRDY
jgi:uncharacterized membrane-anchored protein YitT (DUF2179 family)